MSQAFKHKALSQGHIDKLEAQLRDKVQALLQKAAETDAAYDKDGFDLSDELARREQRLAALIEAKAKIAGRVKRCDEQAQQDYQDKLERRESQRQAGKKPRAQSARHRGEGRRPDQSDR
ncbi:MAG: hypothetical protein ACXW1Z_12125 [Methylobacter sp.]